MDDSTRHSKNTRYLNENFPLSTETYKECSAIEGLSADNNVVQISSILEA